MPKIDQRMPRTRLADRVMWVMLFGLIVACGAMLAYLGMEGAAA